MAERLLSCESLSAGLAMVQQMAGGVSGDDLASKIAVIYLQYISIPIRLIVPIIILKPCETQGPKLSDAAEPP